MKLVRNFQKTISTLFEQLGRMLNQTPTEEELAKIKKANLSESPLEKENRFPKHNKFKKVKTIYEHKGSSYKGKGKMNTDSATFNRARKDIPVGREK